MLSLLFSFHGRINRAQFWFGSLLAGFAATVMFVVMAFVMAALDPHAKPGAAAMGAFWLTSLPVYGLMTWTSLAINVKRLHDRGRTGWIAAAPYVAFGLMAGTVLDAIAGKVSPVEMVSSMMPLLGLSTLINLFFLIDLGCLSGKESSNKYGDPPASPGSGIPQPIPGGPSPKAFVTAQEAMDRAVAQRDTVPVAPKPGALAPHFARPQPAAATPAAAGPRAFGRRATR